MYDNITENQVHIIWWVALCAATISFFGSSFMLVTIQCFGKRKGLSQLIIFLAFADWGWSLSVIIGHTILFLDTSAYTYHVCVFFRVLHQFFGGSTVFWTTCISLFLYRCVFTTAINPNNSTYSPTVRTTQDKILFFFFHVISWGTPATFCVVIVASRQMIQDEKTRLCFPNTMQHFSMWFLPIIICFICSVIVYALLMIRLRSTMTWKYIFKGLRDQTLSLPFRISLYLIVFFVCWSLDITQYLILSFNEDAHIFPLIVAYNIMLMSQGTLDVLVYGLANKEMRKNYTEKLCFCFTLLIFSPLLVIPCMFSGVRRRIQNSNRRSEYEQINYGSQKMGQYM